MQRRAAEPQTEARRKWRSQVAVRDERERNAANRPPPGGGWGRRVGVTRNTGSVGHGVLTESSPATRRCFPFPFGRGPLTVFSFLRQKPTTSRNSPGVSDTQNSSWADWSFGSLNQSRLGSTVRGRVWQSYSRFLRKENWSRNSSRSQLHRESQNSKRRNIPQALSRRA